MGVLAPAERDVEHAVEPHVVHELRPAGEEPGVLVPEHARAERAGHATAPPAAMRDAASCTASTMWR